MIIGNGLIGEAFKKDEKRYENYVVFASGVSNSSENSLDNFKREKDLVIKIISENPNLTFIYFSSVLVGIIDNDYYNHKLDIENTIKEKAKKYIIFRIPQLVGRTGNKNNLINFITNLVKNDKPVNCYKNVYRSLLDIEDLTNIVNYCCDTYNETVFISGIEKVPVLNIINEISALLNKEPIINEVDSPFQNNWFIENSDVVKYAIKYHKIDTLTYTNNVIKKYINK